MVTLACTETYVFDQAWIPAFAGTTEKDRDVSPQPENETQQPDSVSGAILARLATPRRRAQGGR